MRQRPVVPGGFSLIEIIMVLTIIAVLAGVMIPRVAGMIDRMNVSGATRHAATVFVTARHAAIARSQHASVLIHEGTATISVLIGRDTLITRNLAEMFGVRITTTRDSMAYNPIGLGHGAANLRLIIRRGEAADTVVTSRVGRIRW